MKVKAIIDLIEDDGWRKVRQKVRQKGSYRQFHHPNKSGAVTVSGNMNVDMPIGTLNNVLRQAGLKE